MAFFFFLRWIFFISWCDLFLGVVEFFSFLCNFSWGAAHFLPAKLEEKRVL